MRVVCISDTHGLHTALQEASPIPPGDVFVHAGDFTDTGARDEVVAFNAWLATLPHKYKIVIAGNHESTFDRAFYPTNWYNYGHEQKFDPVEVRALLTNALYLEDQAVLIDGFLYYGSPWQPEFCNWAFNLPRGEKLVAKWKQIPSDVDVLVTHTPPMGRGDQVGHLRVGCSDLLREVQTRIKPPYHVFGHVHEGYGRSTDGVTTFMNASSCTHEYEAVNPAMVIDLKRPRAVHDLETNQAIRYDVLLHEQLRVCSQKPAFVPLPGIATSSKKNHDHPHGPCHSHAEMNGRRSSLKEFSVDGTTAALLFESTLKLRPVKAKQTRALRYLFHHGFKAADGEASAIGEIDESAGSLDDIAGDTAADAAGVNGSASGGVEGRLRERRRVSLSRRVTMAVLDELPDATRDAIAPTTAELLTVAAAGNAATTSNADTPAPSAKAVPQRRARRDKTLHRREAVAKLATMVEEPEKEAAAAAETHSVSTTTTTVQTTAEPTTDGTGDATTEASESIPDLPTPTPDVPARTAVLPGPTPAPASTPAPSPIQTPAKECIMCKYKVPGHVHPASDSDSRPLPSPSARGSSGPVIPSGSPTPAVTKDNANPPLPAAPSVPSVVENSTPAAPSAECILCKYKVAGHVHPGAETTVIAEDDDPGNGTVVDNEDEATAETVVARARAVGPKRLSSWF